MAMMRNRPTLKYCGLTVILANQSRFDRVNLLSGPGGQLFNMFCLRPEFNSMMVDVRLTEDKSEFLPGTKCVMVLGEAALWDWIPECRGKALNEVRGGVYKTVGDVPCIASFYPQDAADIKSHEQNLNKLSKEYVGDGDGYEKDEEEDYDSVKKLGRTKRSNYAFWLRADVRKCKSILANGWQTTDRQTPSYITYPPSSEVIKVLTETKNQHFYFDMETDYEEQNLQCFSFTFNDGPVYNVPVLDYNYRPAYSNLPSIIHALAVAIRDNTIVSHNGAAFDFLVLAYKYNIPVKRCYDTMLAMHRCFPDVEKSLGHCVSYWTWERFHKSEDSEGYLTKEQMMQRLAYCGKDVWTMKLVHEAIEKYAKTIPGLKDSIDTANSCIVPYLTTSIQGIRYNQQKLEETQKENDRLMTHYMDIINELIGPVGLAEIRKQIKGKAKSFAGSNTQCCYYFHTMLGYPVIATSPKTGKPSLGKKHMYKLALKYDNPVITFVLLYRTIAKEYGTLKFMPWRGDDNKIIKPNEYQRLAENQSTMSLWEKRISDEGRSAVLPAVLGVGK